MKCLLCGFEFNEEDTKSSCEGCMIKGNCSMCRCPNCGYEVPKTPEFLKRIINRGIRKNEADK